MPDEQDPKPLEDQGGKHEKPRGACNGAGMVAAPVVDRKIGKVDVHRTPCPGCGGTGRG